MACMGTGRMRKKRTEKKCNVVKWPDLKKIFVKLKMNQKFVLNNFVLQFSLTNNKIYSTILGITKVKFFFLLSTKFLRQIFCPCHNTVCDNILPLIKRHIWDLSRINKKTTCRDAKFS